MDLDSAFSKARIEKKSVLTIADQAQEGDVDADVGYGDILGPLSMVRFSLSSQRRLRAAGSEP
jgi:hypothetical protein